MVMDAEHKTLSQLELMMANAKMIIRLKKKRIDNMGRRSDLNEDQKIFIGQELEFIKIMESLMKLHKEDIHKSLGKLPPQALDMEEAVLGAIMTEQQQPDVFTVLEVDHFYSEPHKTIYKAILDLNKAGQPIDMLTVVNQLRANGTIEIIGGAAYIAGLTSRVSSAANIQFHIHVIIEHAIRRQMILISGNTIYDSYDDTVDVFKTYDRLKAEIQIIESWKK